MTACLHLKCDACGHEAMFETGTIMRFPTDMVPHAFIRVAVNESGHGDRYYYACVIPPGENDMSALAGSTCLKKLFVILANRAIVGQSGTVIDKLDSPVQDAPGRPLGNEDKG